MLLKNAVKKILDGYRFFRAGTREFGVTRFVKIWQQYNAEYAAFVRQKGTNTDFVFGEKYPIFTDKYASSGTAKGAYFHQDLLVARRIFENNPKTHIDVGSRVDGFVAHVASFRHIHIMDIRPLESAIKNISFLQLDVMAPLKPESVALCDSISCLHAMEHFGLGRYGDPLDYNGHVVGLENLYKMLQPEGKFYFSVPISLPQRIEFNAHRIFSVQYLVDYFAGKYRIDNFSYVNAEGDLCENVPLTEKNIAENYGCTGAGWECCAIFEMTKLP